MLFDYSFTLIFKSLLLLLEFIILIVIAYVYCERYNDNEGSQLNYCLVIALYAIGLFIMINIIGM